MKFLAGLLFHNLVYKIVALLVAAVLWAAVQGAASVERSLNLQIDLQDLPESLVVVYQSVVEVNVRLVGSRAALRVAQNDLTTYPITLGGLNSPGEALFQVNTERLLPPGVDVLAWAPSTVVVRTETVVRKKVAVRADVVGEPPEGYRVLEVDVEPSQITLAGARSSIRRIREVLTDRVDVSGITETQDREIQLAFGGSLVWRAAEDGVPLSVHIEVEGPPEPEPPEDDTETAETEPGSSTG